MAAALVTPVSWSYVHDIPRIDRVNKVTQSDWVFLAAPGAYAPSINNYIGTVGTFTYGTVTIYNASTAYSATTESIVVVGGATNFSTAQRFPFYIETTGGEILQVTGASSATATGGTWAVIRGCLGTTASATGLTHASTVYVKNVLTLSDAGTGYVYITYQPMPEEPKAKIFSS